MVLYKGKLSMKHWSIDVVVIMLMIGMNSSFANDEPMPMHNGNHHDMSVMDTRISLKLSPKMKQHQLTNMRGHVEAIKSIVGLMAENKFDEASKTAYSGLGLTPEMQAMCGMFDNKEFNALGLAFHQSGDELGKVLKAGDVNASLSALNKTMQYCVQCHATYRQ
jgi:hypothetical protein